MTRTWKLLSVALIAACRRPRAPVPPVAPVEETVVQAVASHASDSTAPPPAVPSRDSAAVTIVETHVPAWDSAAGWTVDTTPSLSVGETDGADPYLFSRIAGAIRREDGAIMVAAARPESCVCSTRRGSSCWARADGEGPAEFSGIERIGSLWAERTVDRCSIANIRLEYAARVSPRVSGDR